MKKIASLISKTLEEMYLIPTIESSINAVLGEVSFEVNLKKDSDEEYCPHKLAVEYDSDIDKLSIIFYYEHSFDDEYCMGFLARIIANFNWRISHGEYYFSEETGLIQYRFELNYIGKHLTKEILKQAINDAFDAKESVQKGIFDSYFTVYNSYKTFGKIDSLTFTEADNDDDDYDDYDDYDDDEE